MAVSEDVARLTEDISKLELQKNHALDSAKSFLKSLSESTQDFKTSEFKLGVEQRNIETLQQEVASLRDENRRIRKQQSGSASTATRLQQLQQKYDGLLDDYYTLKDEHIELVEDAVRYRREREEYKDDAEYYRVKRDTVRTELVIIQQKVSNTTKKYANLLLKIKCLRLDYQELKRAHDLREPLVKIGVDIRLRFLDQARETALNVSRDKADMVLRSNGNIAAHRGNAAADAALFKGKFIPEEYKGEAEEIFQELYQCPSNQYAQ